MGKPIKVLLVEDQPADARLMLNELRRAGYEPTMTRVETAEEMRAALAGGSWDVIISDYNLPLFDATSALKLLQASGHDLPFIVVTGTIGEDRAAAILKAGAHDFILKDQLTRLTAAIERETGDARVRADHRQALLSLRSTNQELSALVAASPLAIFTLGPSGLIRRWNEAAERLFGWTAGEVVGRELPTIPTEAGFEAIAMRSDVLRGRSFAASETRWQRKDRSPVEITLSMAPLRSGGSEVDGIICLASDMTERKNLEKQLQQTQKMEVVGKLAGGIAHDFNNLLTVINGRSQLLLNRLKDDPASRRDAELILETGERAARLTRQLLAFSRRQVFQMREVDLNRAVADMRKMLATMIGEDIELLTSLAPELPAVRTDPSQLEQVVLNLAVNAREAMSSGGRLIIATAMATAAELVRQGLSGSESYVRLAVSDTGVGIDEPTSAHIFEPFFTTKQQGTGLGLSTVDGIVRQSGGFIRVDSAVGHGATFAIYLPASHGAQSDDDTSHYNLQALGKSSTVLVVEDDDAVRALIHESLSSYGYQVLSASNWQQALEAVETRDGQIDLLLTDLVMPHVGGREVAQRLTPMCPGMKVLYMSGYTEGMLGNRGGLLPGVQLIQKPFSPRKLVKNVRRALAQT